MYEDEEYLNEYIDFSQEEENVARNPLGKNDGSSLDAGWTKDAIKALLTLYEANSHIIDNPRKKTKIWAIIAKDLHQFGIEKTVNQVRWKMYALQKKYKECIDNNGKSGRGHMTFEFYDKLEEIFNTGKKAAATYTLTSNLGGGQKAENSIEPNKNSNENDPGNAIESHRAGTSGLQQSKKNLTSGKRKHELEDQWLSHLKKFEDRQELADEKYAETKKMRMESLNLKKAQLAVRERQTDVTEKIATKKLKSKEKRHDELLEIEQQKCRLLERLLNKP